MTGTVWQVDPALRPALAAGGLDGFDALWSWPGEIVDEPNRRGRGFSQVFRHHLDGDGAFYRKQQQDYFPRGLPGRDLLLLREYRALQRFAAAGVDTLEVAVLALRRHHGHRQGLLVTRALTAHQPLDRLLAKWQGRPPDIVSRALADYLRHMHGARLFHGNLYPKHLFIDPRLASGQAVAGAVRVIDLEDARWLPFGRRGAIRDLEKLHRYADGVSGYRRLRFLLRYLGLRRLDRRGRGLLDAIVARSARRRRSGGHPG